MRILLVNMPWKCKGLWGVRAGSRWPHIRHLDAEKDYLPYPFFLGYATSLLLKNGFEAKLIDAIAERIETKEFIELVKKNRPDLIVAETSTPSLNHDLFLITKIRDIAPLVLCGPEYNIKDISFLKDKPFIDYVMVGEYEETLLELIQKLENKQNLSSVKGLIYRKDGKLYKNTLRPLIRDLDSLPWPYREGLSMENYVDAPGGMPLPCAQMWTSRGCPYKCIFCLWPHIMYHGNTYRMRKPSKVVDEMEYLIKELKFKSIYIDDDTTNINKKFLIEIANEMITRKLKIPWAIMARPDLMDEELLKTLRKAGLYSVKYGVESGVQELIDKANKKMNLAYAIEQIKLTNKLGIKTHLTFTFGLPGETKETIEKTINLALELKPYSIQFSITTPFPGTTYYKQLKEAGWQEPQDWSLFDGHKAAVVNFENLSSQELEEALNQAYRYWFENNNQLLLKKSLWREFKTFLDCTKLYGIKFALEKTESYLEIKKEVKRKKIFKKKSQNYELVKGILNGEQAYTGPKIAVIDITDRCNISCLGCWLHSPFSAGTVKLKSNCELDLKTIMDLVDELHKLEVEEIQISGGGEPLMHPAIFEIIKYIEDKGINCHLITNFTLVNEKKIDEIIKLGLDYITVSLWAGDSETYAQVHPNVDKAIFKKIKKDLVYLIQKRKNDKPVLKIYNVILKENYHNIDAMLDFALEVGADFLEFQLLDPIPGKSEHLLIGEKEAEVLERKFISWRERKDYVSDYISNDELLVFDCQEHRRELSDFGKFVKNYDKNFTLLNGIRTARCPQGHYSIGKDTFPKDNVRYKKFFFDLKKCRVCKSYRDCYKEDSNSPFRISFLTILGIQTFLRRINSVSNKRLYLDGDFLNTLPCYAGWSFARVTTNGDVKPCCKAEKLILGNIKEKKFFDIWFSSAYNNFRSKCKILPKKDNFFSEINCYKVCDNLGMNLMIHKQVLEHIKPKKELVPKVIYKTNKIIIPAVSFITGNLNRGESDFGREIALDGGHGFGYAKYEFEVKDQARYEIWSKYAAQIPRPITLKIDGINFGKIMKISTGGWKKKHLRLFKESEVVLSKGWHNVELFCESYFPHFERLELRRKNTMTNYPTVLADPCYLYHKREPLKILKESLRTHGVKISLKRTINYLKPRNFLNNYLDIIGIFDGKIAYKGPFHVQIDLTNNCNNNCLGCWCNSPLLEEKRMDNFAKRQYLPYKILKELLDEVKYLGTKETYYSGGGEPFMHEQIMEILNYTKSLGFNCYVNTNFTLLDKNKIDEIIKAEIDHFTVSIWASNAKTYALTHPNKSEATFYSIKDNLIYLNRNKNKKPFIKLYQVIFNLNYREIKEMIDFAHKTGCESVEFTLIDTIPGKTDKLALNPLERQKLFEICQDVKKELTSDFKYKDVQLFRFDQFLRRLSNENDVLTAKYDRNVIDLLPCYIGWLFARILPDGNVNSCLKSHRFPVGNIFEQNFSDIWNSPKQIYFREKTLCYKKEDPFFRLIGNDPETKEAGCYKSCDDIGRNLHMHKKIMSLTSFELKTLKLIAKYFKYRRNKNNTETLLYNKTSPKFNDRVIWGIIDGRKAYQGPEHVVIDLTNRCQLRCIACWLYSPYLKENKPSLEWLRKEIPFPRAKSLINEFSHLGVKIIRFTGGGEPILYPDVLELFELIKSNGIKACLTTNLYQVKEKFLNELIELKVDEVTVSVWAGDTKTYVEMHPGTKESAFIELKEKIRYFNSKKDKNTKVTIANVITNKNYKNIFEMAKFAQEVKTDAVYFTLADVFPNETDFLLLNEEQTKELSQEFEKVESYLKTLGIEIENLKGFKERINSENKEGYYDYSRIDRIPCYVGWFFVRILADGIVVPCCRGVNYPLGNINENSFQEIWFSLKYNGFRSRAKYLKKDHPYFQKMNCYKECDNLMHNEEMHKKINQINYE